MLKRGRSFARAWRSGLVLAVAGPLLAVAAWAGDEPTAARDGRVRLVGTNVLSLGLTVPADGGSGSPVASNRVRPRMAGSADVNQPVRLGDGREGFRLTHAAIPDLLGLAAEEERPITAETNAPPPGATTTFTGFIGLAEGLRLIQGSGGAATGAAADAVAPRAGKP